jgi:uncharacterized membrane protein
MLLLLFLIIPIIFWLIPLSGLRKRDSNSYRRLIINFFAMLITVIITGLTLWFLDMGISTILVVLLSISIAWGAFFHLISGRKIL